MSPHVAVARRSLGLSILNVGIGDTKITFDKKNPAERERACRIVQDMLKRGYAILIQAGEKDGKPIYYRATAFDPETAEYIIAGVPDDEPLVESAHAVAEPEPTEKAKRDRRWKRVRAEGTPAVGVARSAGGMSSKANSIEASNQRQMDNMRRFDKFVGMRDGLTQVAAMKSEWAGIPMPLQGEQLIIEPKYPYAAELMAMTKPEGPEKAPEFRIRSRFFSHKLSSEIVIVETADGRIDWGPIPAVHSLGSQVKTMASSDAWGIEQEATALQLLGTLLPHHQFKKYALTGMFMESSSRSRLTYIFRKLRPTVAIAPDLDGKEMRIVATLCMHPIAYYADSWAGAMCPTDDVIAHLMLMRADERMFWRRSNQHPAWRPESGL